MKLRIIFLAEIKNLLVLVNAKDQLVLSMKDA
jgi:hypothetical protein